MLARVIIWLGAVVFAILPLMFVLGKEKGFHVDMLLSPSEYDGLSRDLCFVGIAVLAIGLVDAGESLVLALESENRIHRKQGLTAISVTVVITLEIVIFAWISGSAQTSDKVGSLLFYFFLSSFMIAAASRYQVLRKMA